MKIGEVAAETQVSASAIRYYEKIGLLPAPTRVSGQRLYTPGVVPRLNFIQLAKAVGFTLEEIGDFLNQGGTDGWREIAHRKIVHLNEAINRYEVMRDALQTATICDCVEDVFAALDGGS